MSHRPSFYTLPSSGVAARRFEDFVSRTVNEAKANRMFESATTEMEHVASAIEARVSIATEAEARDDVLQYVFEALCTHLGVPSLDPETLRTLFLMFHDGLPTAPEDQEWKLAFGVAAVTFNKTIAVQVGGRWHTFSPLGFVTSTSSPPAEGVVVDLVLQDGIPAAVDAGFSFLSSTATAEENNSKHHLEGGNDLDAVTTEDLAAFGRHQQPDVRHAFAMVAGEGQLEMTFLEGESDEQLHVRARTFATFVLVDHPPSLPLNIFVHGYNNSNVDARQRAAALSVSLQATVTPFLWPSANSFLAYRRDQITAASASTYLFYFISELSLQARAHVPALTPPPIHLIAHSMGNYATVLALEKFQGTIPDGITIQMISAAADVGPQPLSAVATTFTNWTSYYNPDDWVLKVSSVINNESRSGRMKVKDVQSIRVADPSSAHAYMDDADVQQDLTAALRGVPVGERPHVVNEGGDLVLHQ